MENIYIDTNIFISQNFLEGKYIKKLLLFSENEKIQIILAETTINEVKSQFKTRVTQAFAGYRQYMNLKSTKYLRNLEFGKKVNDYSYSKIRIEDFQSEFEEKLDEKLRLSKVVILPYNDNIDSKNILEAYFNEHPPFSSKKNKKLGFPDAFIIENLKQWVLEEDNKLTILSGDADFNFLALQFDNIIISNDIKGKYNEIVNAIKVAEEKLTKERLEMLDYVYKINVEQINKDVRDYFKEGELDDESLYYEHTTENIYDISNVVFQDVINHGYNIKSIINEEEIKIEILIDVWFTIDVLTDDINTYVYDKEDGVIYYLDQETLQVEGKIDITMDAVMYVVNRNEYEEIIDYDIKSSSYEILIQGLEYH